MRWKSAAVTHVGQRRKLNEDAFLEHPDVGVWAVADGMGGHDGGEVAARAVIDALGPIASNERLGVVEALLEQGLQAANQELSQANAQREGRRVMGTTVVAAAAGDERCALVWVGDSRAYRLREGELERLTHDHSLVQEMVDRGELNADEAEHHPSANVITRAVGVAERLQVAHRTIGVMPRDRLLLCSDGLYKDVAEEAIQALLGRGSPTECATALLNAALEGGGRDNITLVIIDFIGG